MQITELSLIKELSSLQLRILRTVPNVFYLFTGNHVQTRGHLDGGRPQAHSPQFSKGSDAVMQPVFCATARSMAWQLAVSHSHSALLVCVFGLKELFFVVGFLCAMVVFKMSFGYLQFNYVRHCFIRGEDLRLC